jgi:transposase
MYSELERYMVKQYRQLNVPQSQVAELLEMNERTVRRIEQETAAAAVPEPTGKRPVGRPRAIAPYESLIRQWLEEERLPEDGAIQTREILERLQAAGYSGSKSPVYALVQRLRPLQRQIPMIRFEGLPGEFSQHDYGERRVSYADGSSEVVHFFVSRLKYSRYLDVQVVPNEQLETLIRALLRAFERFEGMPLKCVFDNMRTVFQKRQRDEQGQWVIEWNRRFSQFCIDCGFIPLLCSPYQPQQKGSVENGVKFVKSNFFPGRRFYHRRDLERQLNEWLVRVNQERPSQATQEIPAVRRRQERLHPCPHTAESYALKISVVVRSTARVVHQGFEYSVPAQYCGQTVSLHLRAQEVAIYVLQECIATHPRLPENGTCSILPEHLQESFVTDRGRIYAKRQLLLDLAPSLQAYLTEVVHRRPLNWEADVDSLYELYLRLGYQPFVELIAQATEQKCFGSEYIWMLSRRIAS